MRVQHNIVAMNSYRNYNNNTSYINKNLEKLSSGYRINRAGDDAAGLAISEKMRAQITGIDVAQRNAKDGISLVQTAEGALTEVHSMLNRMYELAEQSANGTYAGSDNATGSNAIDRDQLQKELDALVQEVDRIANTANFNGIQLLDGSMSGTQVSQDIRNVIDGTNTTPSTTGISEGKDSGGNFSKVGDNTNAAAEAVAGVKIAYTVDDQGNFTAGAVTGVTGYTASFDSGLTKLTLTDGTNSFDFTLTTDTNASGNSGTITLGSKNSVSALGLQIGDTVSSDNMLAVTIDSVKSSDLGVDSLDISTQAGALSALDSIKTAINTVSETRGGLGATQNRLEHTINNLSTMKENLQDAESTIRDTDVAEEMMKYTKNSILVQSAQAMLAQANQQPQGVLQLLQ